MYEVNCVCLCEWERVREKDTTREGETGEMDLMPVHTMVWHYESWRLLCLTSDVFWSSQWASGERLDESSAEQHRGAAEILNGSEIWNDFGVNVFMKIAAHTDKVEPERVIRCWLVLQWPLLKLPQDWMLLVHTVKWGFILCGAVCSFRRWWNKYSDP